MIKTLLALLAALFLTACVNVHVHFPAPSEAPADAGKSP